MSKKQKITNLKKRITETKNLLSNIKLTKTVSETPDMLDHEDSMDFKRDWQDRIANDPPDEIKKIEKIKKEQIWNYKNFYARKYHTLGPRYYKFYLIENNKVKYESNIAAWPDLAYIYQSSMGKRRRSKINAKEILDALLDFSKFLKKKGLMSSESLTIGGYRFWKKLLTHAQQSNYTIGIFDAFEQRFTSYNSADRVLEIGYNSSIYSYVIQHSKDLSESPVASDRDASDSMKNRYHGTLETISADLEKQEPDISFDEFDFYYKVDTNAVHYSENVFVMKDGERPIYFATLREFMGYLYQFFMAKADSTVSITKERILMGLFKLSKKLNKKGIKTSDTLSYGGKHFWINIVKIALDKNYPVWINDREETFPIANSDQADEMFEKHNVFGDEGVDIYIGNSPKKNLTESIEGQGFDIYVHQFDGYKVQLNISSNDMSVKSQELEALVMDKRYDVYKTLNKENKKKLETQWKEVEQHHVNKLEQNLGSLTEDYLATANALIHLEIQDTVNSYSNLLNNFQGVTEESQLNEYIEDRETGVKVDVSQRRDGLSALVNISSNELTTESDRLKNIFRLMFDLSRKSKEKNLDSNLEKQLDKDIDAFYSNFFDKGYKDEVEKAIYELTVDYWSTARSILEIKTEQIGIEAEHKIEELKRKYGL